jgi:hypothetical protein
MGKRGPQPVNENTPLTPWEEAMIYEFITGKPPHTLFDNMGLKYKNENSRKSNISKCLHKPNVQKKIRELMGEMDMGTIMTGQEVMEYFTAVARGEVKDQFGLDAPLSERTAAAKEIAKRTIDIELKEKGYEDKKIDITLNWNRDD